MFPRSRHPYPVWLDTGNGKTDLTRRFAQAVPRRLGRGPQSLLGERVLVLRVPEHERPLAGAAPDDELEPVEAGDRGEERDRAVRVLA